MPWATIDIGHGIHWFGDPRIATQISVTDGEVMLTDEFEHFSQFYGPCVRSSENKNVTDTQKELLLWTWKLGIIMYCIQELMK